MKRDSVVHIEEIVNRALEKHLGDMSLKFDTLHKSVCNDTLTKNMLYKLLHYQIPG